MLHAVKQCYIVFRVLIPMLHDITRRYIVLQGITQCYIVLYSACYMLLQGITQSYMMLHSIT